MNNDYECIKTADLLGKREHNAKPAGFWIDLPHNKKPIGAPECAKYATIGAGPDNWDEELSGGFNRPSDVEEPLRGATYLGEQDAVALVAKVDLANFVMNGNFRRTDREYELKTGRLELVQLG